MDSPLVRRLLTTALVAVLVVIALLWWWPRGAPKSVAGVPEKHGRVQRPVEAASSTPAAGEPQVVKVEEHADLIGAPPLCKTIVEWHRRNVPAWVIEDNMDAQAMKFDAEEMKCLAEKGVPDQVLDRAEYNQRVPQPARKP